MKCNLKKPLTLKDGSTYAKGTKVLVSVKEDRPSVALLQIGNREIKIRSASLYRYFKNFEPMDMTDPDLMDSIVPSLTGEMVEPDGWDEYGFPSVLLAAGMI